MAWQTVLFQIILGWRCPLFSNVHTKLHTRKEREGDMEKEQITRWNNRYSAEDKNHRKPIPASAQHAHYYITTITVPTLERMCVG